MNANANLYALILRQSQIQLQELALDFHGGAHSRPGIWKFRHRGITDRLNHFAVISSDGTVGQLIVAMDHYQASRIAIALKEAGRADHVGEQHRQGILVPAELLIYLSS